MFFHTSHQEYLQKYTPYDLDLCRRLSSMKSFWAVSQVSRLYKTTFRGLSRSLASGMIALETWLKHTPCCSNDERGILVEVMTYVLTQCTDVLGYLLPPTSPWSCRLHGPAKRWYPNTTLHDVITQKFRTWIFKLLVSGNLRSQHQFYCPLFECEHCILLWVKLKFTDFSVLRVSKDTLTQCDCGWSLDVEQNDSYIGLRIEAVGSSADIAVLLDLRWKGD
jgi:hypothetical protein